MRLKEFLLQFFTWWNGQTLGTRFYTWRKGTRVGEDEFGNVYYEGGKDPMGGTRRWVIYNGESDASKIPPGWYGWLHRRTDVPPTQEDFRPRPWMKPHTPNLTGTDQAYRPPGSIRTPEKRPVVTGDYDAWTPGG